MKFSGQCETSMRLRRILASIIDKAHKQAQVTYLGHFNNIKEKSQHMALVLEMYRPHYKGPMVWR